MTETYSEGGDDRVGGGDAGAADTAGRRVGRETHDADGTRVVLTLERAEDTCGRDADLDDGGEGYGEEGGETHGERAGRVGSSLVSRASGFALRGGEGHLRACETCECRAERGCCCCCCSWAHSTRFYSFVWRDENVQ